MSTLGFLAAYFTSPLSLSVLGLSYGLIAVLSIFFFKRPERAKARSRILTAIFSISIFVWVFVALSLIFCHLLYGAYEYDLGVGIKKAFGGAVIGGFILTLPLSLGFRSLLPGLMLQVIGDSRMVKGAVRERFELISSKMRIKEVGLLETAVKTPPSFAVNGRNKFVVVSNSILSLLDPDEIETVIAHELAHIKNGDIMMKALVFVFRTILLFDPLIRLVEAAINREREYLADETATVFTGKPLALASALLKIHESDSSIWTKSPRVTAIIGYGRGLLSRHPPLEQRIDRLLRIAESETAQ